MANKKISDLSAIVTLDAADLFEVVDVSEASTSDQNKKITADDLGDQIGERGSWTPTISFAGAAVGLTYTTQEGTYLKVGKTVFAKGYIDINNAGSSSGQVRFEGLPYAVKDVSATSIIDGFGSIMQWQNTGNTLIAASPLPRGGTSYALTIRHSNAVTSNNVSFDDNYVGAGSKYDFYLIYETA